MKWFYDKESGHYSSGGNSSDFACDVWLEDGEWLGSVVFGFDVIEIEPQPSYHCAVLECEKILRLVKK